MLKKCFAAITVLALLGSPAAFAEGRWDRHDRDHDRDDRRGYHHRKVVYHRLPPRYHRVFVRNTPYFYSEGLFYQPVRDGYVMVAPPMGAVVPVIPHGATVIYQNGMNYYYYDNVYYAMTPRGYEICRPRTVVYR